MSFAEVPLEPPASGTPARPAKSSGAAARTPRVLVVGSFGSLPPARPKAVGPNGERAEARIPRGPPAGWVVGSKP